MLTRDLLRYKRSGDRLIPTLLKPTPAIVELARGILEHWQSGVGGRRGDLDDAVVPILHQSRALVVARGLNKLVCDACEFSAPTSCAALRAEALAVSARQLHAPLADDVAHRAQIAAAVNLSEADLSERLYGDLPDRELLQTAPKWSPTTLIAHYNMALCQGLLLGARALQVELMDADVGLRRKIIKAIRFRRLLVEVTGSDAGVLRFTIAGPDVLLDQASRYGLQLAQFFPALCCAGAWTARAEVRIPRREPGPTHAWIEWSDQDGLVGESRFLGYIPPEIADLTERLVTARPDWRCEDGAWFQLPGGELAVPDVRVMTPAGAVDVELFHRWHAQALERRLRQVADGLMPRLMIGVERHVAKTTAIAQLVATPLFAERGFLFSDIPAPRAVIDAVTRRLSAMGAENRP